MECHKQMGCCSSLQNGQFYCLSNRQVLVGNNAPSGYSFAHLLTIGSPYRSKVDVLKVTEKRY